MKTKLFSFVLMFTAFVSYAQQDAQFTQYMYNTININPAYAGSRGALSIFALHRTQWVGLDGAPVTNAASVNTPLNESNLGLGVSIINDKIGPTTENTISADLSYTVPTSETFKLSFGIKATANFFNLDVNRLNPVDDDPSLHDFNNKFTPNIGAGVYLHSDKAYVGFSIPNFIESNRYDDNEVAIFKEKINYYLMAGYVFDLNESIKFKPALLTKVVAGAPLQLDVSGNFMFSDKFVVGIAYRWSAAVSAMVGFQVSDGMYIGYGYDHETTNLNNYNSGSHEIFLRYEIFKNNGKITTPRFF
ncbi:MULTISPECIES: PorP/SprF family type IX secretion system membrane protein [Flavobacterium]|jgi:type IX secretion system PorP/SprF family membrane protein|uniref:Type IX secretion system membrane protein PorP/SprF n=1 Tax=Flavobacterium algoritolerans TaxID=3041254 RepID=A0ABT6VCZ2_9FLAO|nr:MULTISPECIES: type IX secretion system membrane protein PorP/SprF [Flavobacterium]MDI5889447.1 type IX secretion system membrane protein PorP/SprF [Flavobacterium yafengii]MDI5889451.1 type IX secretion system membrane protein PorP/SprF [Flavobacterium yafengii]MDI5896080.1 type IX secretion system membrane protein PorP/SprF [Flavobacterium algoritolerans]MDI5896083.1 type IX secretion system membrane protein PorP/SprF [Flavobacterium algoritolerans]MDI6051329.1 type IX secretion system mem